jgi:hypothetical protein
MRNRRPILSLRDLPAGPPSLLRGELNAAELSSVAGGLPVGGGGTSTNSNDLDGNTTCTSCCDCD